ncbi:MAG TPA: hypothetical protein VFP65_16625 [Anaeromyxobacteraceae bacterium]|nr:hypothetical protein [Anaeromyxobacteraceae bacterium]
MVALGLAPGAASAWIYPEHRDIGVEAIARLQAGDRAALESLWGEALPGYAAKLCERLSAGDQGLQPACIDFAAIPALSGDHSCSPADVLEHVLPSEWILGVARVSAETKASLAGATSRAARLNAIATNNLKLQVVDPEYATRAGSNVAHFLLPRSGDDLGKYVAACFAEGAPLNALGLYGLYHVTALGLAQRLAAGEVPGAERGAAAREVLALEGFALHWLEDIYSSGHDVGTWGDVAWRKGTHDYYSEFGLDTVDWKGRPVVAFGDANMAAADLERASSAVAVSLTQLARALRPGDELGQLVKGWGSGPAAVRAFDACKEKGQPTLKGPGGIGSHFADQIERMPKPARGPGEVHVPRFRDELGPFVSVFGAVGGGVGFGSAAGTSATGSLSAGVRVGYGADSLTGSIGTGIAFLEAGFAAQSAQKGRCEGDPGCAALGPAAFFPRVPARTGLALGLRLPFWVLPGDMLILGPVLALTSPERLAKVGVEAASGGLLPYERSFLTGAGVFQVVVGREFRVVLFGYAGSPPVAVLPSGAAPDGTTQYAVVEFKEVQLQFPVLEWTPFRTFATQLTFATQVQLGFSVGLPSTQVLFPAGASFSTGLPWQIWVRGAFDGRYFLGSREDLQAPR